MGGNEFLGDIFEPIRKEVPKQDINASLRRTSNLGKNDDDESNLSIIQALSHNVSSSNLSIDSNQEGYLNSSNFNGNIDDDTDSISSTSSIVVPRPKAVGALADQAPGASPSPLLSQHIPQHPHGLHASSNVSHLNNSSSQNVSVQDFFFNNPHKTKMNLSSTSLDDVNSLGNVYSSPYAEKLGPPSLAPTPSHPQAGRSPYGQLQGAPTLVKPKAMLRNVTPQPLVNEVLPKKPFLEPKLSSMRINRTHHSNLRNLKTASILSLDKKIGVGASSGETNGQPSNDDSDPLQQKNIMDTYNYDSVSGNYTDLLQNEEDEVMKITKDCNRIVPFGGFSRPHRFTDDMDDIFNTSPWKVVEFDKGNGSLINSIESARDSDLGDFTWMGTISIPSNIVPENIKADITTELEDNYNSDVIFLDDEVFQGHYKSFCKQILWPIFHYQIPDNPKSNAFENHSWKYYEELNQIYADKIAEKYKKGDIIWVHDYHLMLLPLMLRKLIPDAKIAFFLHISFPSSEVFRCLAQRKKILEGMLGADCITFQNEEYMAHFLQSSNRLLLADFNSTGVYYNNRLTTVSYNAIGLNFKHLNTQLRSNIVNNWKNLIEERWPNKKLIVSRDKIDQIRGLKEKLLAYERFLDDHPEYISETILILICVQSGSTDEDYKNELLAITERINSKTRNISIDQPVILLNQDIEFEQYLALLSEANVFIVSTLREGMNLTCHEFICASEKLHSPLILSEFVGSASVLTKGPLLSNPYNIRQVSSQIYQCLNMLDDEKIERWNSSFQQILNNDSETWVRKCLLDIENAYANSKSLQSYNTLEPLTKKVYENVLRAIPDADGKRLYVLNLDDLTANLEIHGQTIHSYQQQLIHKTLTNLSADSNNYVYIFSIFQRSELLRLYRRVPDIGLIAENGGIIKPPKSSDWFTVVDESEKAWIPTVVDIIKAFCERLPGSYYEVEECTVMFHTETTINIDKDYKNGLIGDLITHINELFEKEFNVHASLKSGILIVKEMNLITRALEFIMEQNKGNENLQKLPSTASAFTSPVFQARGSSITHSPGPISPIELTKTSSSGLASNSSLKCYDFIFACGATTQIDEEIFSYFNSITEYSDSVEVGDIVTVCVGQTGKSRTCAKYSLKGINNLINLLN
ncbi:hypothetical protein PMKS-001131 [Pichia membranifaciens]|uniref:Uncharacterized protein n=1 Tax=Pichia membranifaciens TaxID=4926 RepID=A0A1Q2YE46_9ASCO|nr:hypothetical protein PMKS-001131 [Pichia membranifaciens]